MSPLVDITVIIVFLVLVLTDLERAFASFLACFVRGRLCCSIWAQGDRLRLQGSRGVWTDLLHCLHLHLLLLQLGVPVVPLVLKLLQVPLVHLLGLLLEQLLLVRVLG